MDLTVTQTSACQVTAQLSFTAQDPWVREHFPQSPLLPGSLALAALLHLAGHLAPHAWTVRRLRCYAPVPPGTYSLRVFEHEDCLRGHLVGVEGIPLVSAEFVP